MLETKTVFLVRHGQTGSNANGFYMGCSQEDLSEFEYIQVRRLSLRLAALPVDAIYTSLLRRAYTTAAIVAAPHELDLKALDDLTEIHVGDWQGLYVDEISRKWPEIWQQWKANPSSVTIPGGESLSDVAEHAARVFRRIMRANDGEHSIIIVAHGGIFKIMLALVLGASNDIFWRLEISNASLAVVKITDNRLQLTSLNDTTHLNDEAADVMKPII